MILIADFSVNYAGLATVGYTQKAANGSDSVARTTTGVVDMGNGCYAVDVTLDPTTVLVKWDTGGVSPIYAHEAIQLYDQPIETGFSLRQILRLIAAATSGKLSGAGTSTITIRDINDTKDRIVATVDANGNRSVVTKDVT